MPCSSRRRWQRAAGRGWRLGGGWTRRRLALESFPGARLIRPRIYQEEAARRISGEADEAFFSPAWFMEGIKQQLGGGATEKAEEEEWWWWWRRRRRRRRKTGRSSSAPGGNGPIEDWFNVEKLQIPADDGECPTSLLIQTGA